MVLAGGVIPYASGVVGNTSSNLSYTAAASEQSGTNDGITMTVGGWGIEFRASNRNAMQRLITQMNGNHTSVTTLATVLGIPLKGVGGIITGAIGNQLFSHFDQAASILQTQYDSGQNNGGVRITITGAQEL